MAKTKHVTISVERHERVTPFIGKDAPFDSYTDALRMGLAIGIRLNLSSDAGEQKSSSQLDVIDPKHYLILGLLAEDDSPSKITAGGLDYLLDRLEKGDTMDQILVDLINIEKE